MVFFKEAFSPPPQATGVNCSAQSDLAQLKARQSDVRTLHPEDMMQDDVLVSTLLAQRPPPPLTAGSFSTFENVYPSGQNCSRSWCTEVVCEVQQLLKGQAVVVRVSRRVHEDFFRQVSLPAAPRCPVFKSVFSGPASKTAPRLLL